MTASVPASGYARCVVSGRFACSALALVLLAGGMLACTWARAAAVQTGETVYRLRPDPRMCPSPACGGFWAARVNSSATTCVAGESRAACYVAAVGLQRFAADRQARVRLALPQGRALITGAIVPYLNGAFPGLGALRA